MNDNLAETSSVSSQYDFAEYAQALAFDQLRKIMEAGQAFIGFQEGRIDFPPTFKYDVLRTVKRSKHSLKRPAKAVVAESLAHDKMLTEIEAIEPLGFPKQTVDLPHLLNRCLGATLRCDYGINFFPERFQKVRHLG